MPQLRVQVQQLQVEGGQDPGQGKAPLGLPEVAFVVGIAVAQGRGCPELALCQKTQKTGKGCWIFVFSPQH